MSEENQNPENSDNTELLPPEPPASKKEQTIQEYLNDGDFKAKIALALPKICTPDRFMRVALTAIQKTPKLLKSTKTSLFSSLMACAELGIEPDGRRAYLIPYENKKKGTVECQFQLGYKGLVELVMRFGTVANIHSDVVKDNDIFDYDTGEVKHKIDFRKARGEIYAAYARATFKDGSTKAEVMDLAELNVIRNRSQAVIVAKRFGKETPWDTDFAEMAKKTVFKRLAKWLPLSPELRDAIERDDRVEFPQYDMANAGNLLPEPEDDDGDDAPQKGVKGLTDKI